jgi:uncharacterized DUF497 family protein
VVTWDEWKREANLHNHGLDFEECEAVFDHPVVTQEEDLHVISLREATKHEARYYFEAVSY